jgi:hypothetical protein
MKSVTNLLGAFNQAVSSPESSAKLMSSLVQKDEATGKSYIKIPIESQDVVAKALDGLASLLNQLQK